MPERSKIAGLPKGVRDKLNARLIDNSFSDYRGLSEWLAEQGYEISYTAVYRHGSKLEERIESVKIATESAEAMLEALPDDGGAVNEASLRLAQESLFQLLLATEKGDAAAIAKACRALAEVSRASLKVSEYRRKTIEEASSRANKAAAKAGLSPDTAAMIRAAIEGAL